MQPVKVVDNLYCVGVIDWNVRDFHGYSTPKGTTYNAYLAVDEKITLFDTVKKPFTAELLSNIGKIVDPASIDYIVVNHVEMDHSGALPEVIEAIRPERIFCSAMAKKTLSEHFHREDWPLEVVSSGHEISLGRKTVQFLETRMLHWPDSMMSYLKEDKVLISSDGFGQHWATSVRFDDEVDQEELFNHAAKYYANILLLFSPLVQKLIGEVTELGLEIDVIAPDHGLIWRSRPGKIVEAYDGWSRHQTRERAIIVYDTMWQATEKMAYAVAEGLSEEGVEFLMMNLKLNHRSDVMTEVMKARAVVIGSSTINNGVLPTVADMLSYMKGLRPVGRVGAAFGSYGWSGESVGVITQAMEEMKLNVIDKGVKARFTPTLEDLARCADLGRRVGQAVKAQS